ncbi:alpha/beta hydrolase [soil metagenome]
MTAVAVAIGIMALLLALIWWGQEKLVFFPQGPPYPDATGVHRLDYEAADGQRLFAYVVGDPAGARGVLLCFHGNADLAALQIPWARQVQARTGYAVALAEYRGYAGLGGKPTYAGTLLDAEAAYTAVRKAAGPSARIAFFGHSLGSAVAAELAIKHTPSALLLKAPFTSARDMAPRVITPPLALAFRLVSRVHYDTRAAVAALDAPVWVVHGARDGVIGVEMGRAVFDAAKKKGELLLVDDADHSDVAGRGGTAYWDWIERALR